MEVKCSCEGDGETVFFYACSGGSNVGQMTNEIAKRLTVEGKGSMYCLAGVGGRVSGIVETSRAATKRVAIDGCPLSCAKKTLEEAGLQADVHVVLTQEGMVKAPGFDIDQNDLKRLSEKVESLL